MFCKIAKSSSGLYIIKTIRAIEKLSTSYESCNQDLSFAGCNFSVSYLVPEILAKTWPKSDHFLARITFLLSVLLSPCGSHIFHDVWAYISGSSWDTENLQLPYERSWTQLPNGVLNFSAAFIVFNIYPPKNLSKFHVTDLNWGKGARN